ncbi:uncharacterized protein J3R85_012662 [Psidium guajava]|nr:uncharacterized protein J3R85_012662 [Psidium guajava]
MHQQSLLTCKNEVLPNYQPEQLGSPTGLSTRTQC